MALSWRYRIPISIAWSTPGAALLIAAGDANDDFGAVVGAFLLCGLLLVVTGLVAPLARAMTRIPKPIASAMLAGILFPICVAPVTASVELPQLALPIVLTWLVLFRLAPRWAVPAAMAVAIVVVALSAGDGWLNASAIVPRLEFVAPELDPVVLVSLGIPLYIVTMAGQNVPGFAVLTTLGYDRPPARAALVTTGALSAAGGLFGGHVINLAAITAAIMAGPDAHPDPRRRWVAAFAGGAAYIPLALGAGVATAVVSAAPDILITAAAGLALLGALAAAVTSALEEEQHRIAAIVTFLVVASDIEIAGIGSAFWGLVIGGVLMLWLQRRRR